MKNEKYNQLHEDPEKDILIKDLQEPPIAYSLYYIFLIIYLFNAILVLPIFIGKTLYFFLKEFFDCFKSCHFIKGLSVCIYYLSDILMAVSVMMMYPLAFVPNSDKAPINFQYWAISCLIFLQSYILLQSYQHSSVKVKHNVKLNQGFLKFLYSDQNLLSLGLGRMVNRWKNQKIKNSNYKDQNLKKDLDNLIKRSLKEENIDETLFFFTLDQDEGILVMEELKDLSVEKLDSLIERARLNLLQGIAKENENNEVNVDQDMVERRRQILKLIKTQGFRGKRHVIDNLLWPHFKYMKKKQHVSTLQMFCIIFMVLILKGAFPYLKIVYQKDQSQVREQLILWCFYMGMYLNMISILIGLIINDDLKERKYILNVLETLIIRKGIEDEEEVRDEHHFFSEGSDLPFNNKYKLDLSCNLSLESWDNARRLTILLNKESQDLYETTFSFLAIYLLYAYIILSQDFLGFDLFPKMDYFFKDQLQEYNMFVDFLLIMLLFLTRVNEGSQYNETFERLKDSIDKIAGIYEDKKSLFDYYFSSSIIFSIENPTYKAITNKVFCTASEKVLYALAQKNIKTYSPTVSYSILYRIYQKFRVLAAEQAKQRVLQLCATMEKLVSQIKFDSEHFCHEFLGLWKSNITKTFSTFIVLLYIFFHHKIKSYLEKHRKKDDD